MPINKEKQPISMTKKTGKQKKILKPSSKSTGKKQIISKSKGQNIQIHIDLSKKRSGSVPTGHSRRESKARQEVISHKKDTQPIINLPPPVYGLQPKTNYDNSMFQALNKIMEQNKQFEEALKGEKKKENIFTGREEPVRTLSLGDIINKNTPLRKGDMSDMSTLYTLEESEEPEIEEMSIREDEPEIEERSVRSTRSTTTRTEPEIEEQKEPTGTETLQQLYGTQLETPLKEGGGGGGGRGRRRKEREEIDIGKIEVGQITTKMLNDMKLEELQALAGIKFDIFPYYSAYKRNGQPYNKAKTKEELRREINEARLQKLRK